MTARDYRAGAAAACAAVAVLAVMSGAVAAAGAVPGLMQGLGPLGAYDPWAAYGTGPAAGSALAASPAYDASPYKTAAASSPAPPWAPSWSIFSEEPPGWLWQGSDAVGTSAYRGTYDSAIIRFVPGSLDDSAGGSWADGDSRRYLVFGDGSWADRGNAASSASPLAHSAPSSPSPAQPRTLQDGAVQRPGGGFFTTATLHPESASDLSSRGFVVIPDRPLDLHAPPAAPAGYTTGMPGLKEAPHLHVTSGSVGSGSGDATGMLDIVGLGAGGVDGVGIAEKYGATGSGVTIAIVDTGVDFSNPDIQHALARDPATNHPVMLDPDGQGIVITNSTFYASISDSGTIRSHAGEVPEGFDSVVYVAEDGGVYLDIEQGGGGTTIPVYNSLYPQIGSAPVLNGTLEHDMRIGLDDRDYIRSQSGAYRLGAIFQMGAPGLGDGQPAKIQVVPVLVVDSSRPGVYDTIIPDMSTSWQDYTRGQDAPELDFDFTDERPIVLGSGGEFLSYDSDGDGTDDYTAGTAGARVLDVFAVMNNTLTSHQNEALGAVNGTLLPGLDPDGRFFGVMSDYEGHGTASSATIVSAGKMAYDIYNDTGSYVIGGVAPDARILPIKALWLGDALYGWLWAAGFDNEGSAWSYSGAPRADIISNSWGVSAFPNVGAAPGHDMLSLVVDMLSVPRSFDDSYPGVVVVSSAGNSGHGYGTLGTPGASSFGISAGASTNNVFVGYGPFKDQPRFGGSGGGGGEDNGTGTTDPAPRSHHRGHVVDFSGRGPGIIGDVRPDMVSVGAYGFVPRSMMGASQNADTRDPFTLFGGTSMAGPAIAGAAAVVMSEMTESQIDYDPFVIKNILMSTARDMGNDPFVQGAGLADAGAALRFVHKEGGIFVVHNDDSYQNIRGMLRPAISSANITDTGIGKFDLPDRDIPMTAWFAGHLQPGSRSTATFTIENPGPDAVDVSISPQKMSLVSHASLNGTTVPRQQDPVLNDTDAYIPNYVRLADVRPDEGLAGLFGDGRTIPADASLLVLSVNFAFSDFMNMSADVYADDIGIASLYLYDWVDRDGDLEITSDELLLVTRGGSWGTTQEIRVSDPADKFEGVPMAGIYPVPLRYSYWVGPNGANATALDYTVSASYYAREKWEDVWPALPSVSVPPQDSRQVDVTLIIPDDAGAGIHHGFVAFEGDHHAANVPVSFAVTPVIQDAGSRIVFGGGGALANASGSGTAEASPPYPDVTYSNGHTRGAFDMVGRYMAGDWRHHHFEVAGPAISAASVRISWVSEDTSVSAFVADPAGRIIQTNVPSGVFGHFLDWPSVDWLGRTPFSEGGGFYPVSGGTEGATSTFMTVPINGTGTYAIMTHTTLYGGDSVTEPVGIEVRFYGGGVGDEGDRYSDNGARHNTGSSGPGTGAGPMDPADGADSGDNYSHDPDAAQKDITKDGAATDGGAAPAPASPPESAAHDTQLPAADDISQPAAGSLSAVTAREAGPGFGTGAVAGLVAGAAITAAVFIVIKRTGPASVRPAPPNADVAGAVHGNGNDSRRSGHTGGDGDGDNKNARYGAL